ncbi:A2ML1 protein, partial [Alectura lathami]|nr:A2ML1 protein [Alectura lathami]
DAALKSVTNTGLDICTPFRFQEPAEPEEDERTEPKIWQDLGPQMDYLGTWLWKLVPVGEEGSAEVTVTAPDGIAEWKAGMFCMAPVGLGLAPTTTLTVFKPFFVELALPYTVTCGKDFTVAATVFNNLRQTLRVQVTLADLEELEVLVGADDVDGSCVRGYEARTFWWDVRAISLSMGAGGWAKGKGPWGCVMFLSLSVPAGKVNVTVSAQALHSEELCGTEVPVVLAQGHMDTVTELLVVKVSLG